VSTVRIATPTLKFRKTAYLTQYNILLQGDIYNIIMTGAYEPPDAPDNDFCKKIDA
jgi:hypothetical protein